MGGVGYAQPNPRESRKITYQCTNQPLHKALSEVERLSGYYRIQYVMADVEPYTVTVSMKNQTISQAVAQLLKSTPLKYEVSERFVQVDREADAEEYDRDNEVHHRKELHACIIHSNNVS